jgi:DNA-binding CsgD family transcriptional regulator
MSTAPIESATVRDILMASYEALDLINIGLTVTGAGDQLLLANATAEQILKARDGLELARSGELRTSAGCFPRFLDVLHRVVQETLNGDSGSAPEVLAVRRPSGKHPMTLVVRPVNVKGPSQQLASTGPAAVVLIMDPELSLPTAGPELRELYGLTAAEARLSALLINGRTAEDCCEEMGVSRLTVYSHLKRLFKKVGVQRQSELVSLLLKSTGVISNAKGHKKQGGVWFRYC